jgi:hypothetical protein
MFPMAALGAPADLEPSRTTATAPDAVTPRRTTLPTTLGSIASPFKAAAPAFHADTVAATAFAFAAPSLSAPHERLPSVDSTDSAGVSALDCDADRQTSPPGSQFIASLPDRGATVSAAIERIAADAAVLSADAAAALRFIAAGIATLLAAVPEAVCIAQSEKEVAISNLESELLSLKETSHQNADADALAIEELRVQVAQLRADLAEHESLAADRLLAATHASILQDDQDWAQRTSQNREASLESATLKRRIDDALAVSQELRDVVAARDDELARLRAEAAEAQQAVESARQLLLHLHGVEPIAATKFAHLSQPVPGGSTGRDGAQSHSVSGHWVLVPPVPGEAESETVCRLQHLAFGSYSVASRVAAVPDTRAGGQASHSHGQPQSGFSLPPAVSAAALSSRRVIETRRLELLHQISELVAGAEGEITSSAASAAASAGSDPAAREAAVEEALLLAELHRLRETDAVTERKQSGSERARMRHPLIAFALAPGVGVGGGLHAIPRVRRSTEAMSPAACDRFVASAFALFLQHCSLRAAGVVGSSPLGGSALLPTSAELYVEALLARHTTRMTMQMAVDTLYCLEHSTSGFAIAFSAMLRGETPQDLAVVYAIGAHALRAASEGFSFPEDPSSSWPPAVDQVSAASVARYLLQASLGAQPMASLIRAITSAGEAVNPTLALVLTGSDADAAHVIALPTALSLMMTRAADVRERTVSAILRAVPLPDDGSLPPLRDVAAAVRATLPAAADLPSLAAAYRLSVFATPKGSRQPQVIIRATLARLGLGLRALNLSGHPASLPQPPPLSHPPSRLDFSLLGSCLDPADPAVSDGFAPIKPLATDLIAKADALVSTLVRASQASTSLAGGTIAAGPNTATPAVPEPKRTRKPRSGADQLSVQPSPPAPSAATADDGLPVFTATGVAYVDFAGLAQRLQQACGHLRAECEAKRSFSATFASLQEVLHASLHATTALAVHTGRLRTSEIPAMFSASAALIASQGGDAQLVSREPALRARFRSILLAQASIRSYLVRSGRIHS